MGLLLEARSSSGHLNNDDLAREPLKKYTLTFAWQWCQAAPETKWWFPQTKKFTIQWMKIMLIFKSKKDKWWSVEVFLIAFHFTTKYWPPSVQIYFCHPWCLNKKPFINLKKKHKPSNNQLIWINMAGIEYPNPFL